MFPIFVIQKIYFLHLFLKNWLKLKKNKRNPKFLQVYTLLGPYYLFLGVGVKTFENWLGSTGYMKLKLVTP